ncbi:MAG: hypothetical protein HKN62_09790 [Phycisphaerales bacterium]|nr:hypothetical protein [Phycisphaerales bacterium]
MTVLLAGLGAAPGLTQAPPPASTTPLGPESDLLGDLIDTLEEIEKDLEEAAQHVSGGSGPLAGPTLLAVTDALDSAEGLIAKILDPQQDPSLLPVDAGAADSTVSATGLAEHATTTRDLAADAVTEAHGSTVDHDAIGTGLKTILDLLPGYRAAAGITSS